MRLEESWGLLDMKYNYYSELPSGWEICELGDCADVIDPHPSHRAPAEDKDGYPFLGIGDLDYFGRADTTKVRHVGRNYEITNYSIGYAKMGNTIGKIMSFPERTQNFRYAVSPAISIINPKDNINPYYLRAVVESREFWGQVNGKITGSTRPSIGIQELRKILIPIPSKKMQQFIGDIWNNIYQKILTNNRINDNLAA